MANFVQCAAATISAARSVVDDAQVRSSRNGSLGTHRRPTPARPRPAQLLEMALLRSKQYLRARSIALLFGLTRLARSAAISSCVPSRRARVAQFTESFCSLADTHPAACAFAHCCANKRGQSASEGAWRQIRPPLEADAAPAPGSAPAARGGRDAGRYRAELRRRSDDHWTARTSPFRGKPKRRRMRRRRSK